MNSELEDKKPKKRGRPRKSESQPKNQEEISAADKKKAENLEKMVGSVLDFAGNYLSVATNYGGFKLKPDEKQLLASQGADVLEEFMPMIDNKYVKLGIFTGTLVSIYGVKFYAFQGELQKQMIEANKENEQ